MLKINPNPTFESVVEVTVPGQKEPGTMNLVFKYRSRKEFFDFVKGLEETLDKKGKVATPAKTTVEAFPEFVVGWDLAEDLTAENIAVFLDNYPAAYGEIFEHYSKMLFESRAKN